MIHSRAIAGMGLVRDGVAGRFLGKKWAKKFGPKKALLSSRRAASLLYTPSINGGASVAGQSGTVWAGLASINPSQPVPHCCPSWPEPRTLTRGGEGVVEHSAGELGGCKHWDHPVTVYTSTPLYPRPILPPSALSHSASGV